MAKAFAVLLCFVTLACFSNTVRAACDDIDQYLNVPSPMTGDMEINLDAVSVIECKEFESDIGGTALEQVVVSGGTLTLTSASTVRFVNMGFTVMPGANLVFDLPETEFGPNPEEFQRENARNYMVDVKEGASATFKGTLVANDVRNVFAIFTNAGSLTFKESATFEDNENILRGNTGSVKFSGDTSFKNSRYLAIENRGGTIRFREAASFDNSAFSFDGGSGCSVTNYEGKIIFKGDATFSNDDCGEGVSVYNKGKLKFKSNAYFNDNKNREGSGGAVTNIAGSINFRGNAQFMRNDATEFGGGIAIVGGVVTFKDAVTFDGNSADSGGAFAVLGGKLKFKKPSELTIGDNTIDVGTKSDDENCTIGEVSGEGRVIGFPLEDVCASAN